MPTAAGGETIGEKLTRLRAALVRVRLTIERSETNGSEFRIGGAAVSQIAYEQALARERDLMAQIAVLEARKAGSVTRPGIAHTRTRME